MLGGRRRACGGCSKRKGRGGALGGKGGASGRAGGVMQRRKPGPLCTRPLLANYLVVLRCSPLQKHALFWAKKVPADLGQD